MKLNFTSPKDFIKNYSESKIAMSEKNDCVVRSFASACDWDYDKAHKFVKKEFLRPDKKGTPKFMSTMKRLVNQGFKLGRKSIKPISDSDIKTVGQFVKWYDKGTYIIVVSHHAFTVRDGEVVGGNWNDATKLRCRLLGVWKIG